MADHGTTAAGQPKSRRELKTLNKKQSHEDQPARS